MNLNAGWFPNVKQIADALVRSFGRPSLGNKRNPFSELTYILLSTKTPPDRYKHVHDELKRRYPKADLIAEASIEELVSVIRPAGFANKRASQLGEIAKFLKQRFGRVTLSPLRQMNNEEAEELLMQLPGVGLKIARCVLLYSLDREVFPMDNHCLRISKRLGWLSENAGFSNNTMKYLQQRIPPDLRKDLHVGMVVLGRENCFKTDPDCATCPILRWCPTGQSRVHSE
jgi:endonuclease III